MKCSDCEGLGCGECRIPRFHHCDQCDSDDDVTLVEYDAMVDGPGELMQEWRCRECRSAGVSRG